MNNPATPIPARLSRKIRAVLLISVAFNLLFVGLVVGMAIKGPPDGRGVSAVDRRSDSFYTFALNKEDRRALRRRMQDEGFDLGAGRATARGNLLSIVATLRAEPYDAAAFAAAVANQDKTRETMRIKGQTIFVQHVNGMDAVTRAEFADRLEEMSRRKPHR